MIPGRGALQRFGLLTLGQVMAWTAMALGSGAADPAMKSAGVAGAAYQFPGQPHELVTDAAIPNSPLGTMEQCKSRLGASGDEYCEDVFLALGDLDTFWKDEFLKIAGKNQKYSSPKRFTYYKPEGAHTKCSDPATPGLYCT